MEDAVVVSACSGLSFFGATVGAVAAINVYGSLKRAEQRLRRDLEKIYEH